MALASLPARKRARRMVPQARRHLGWMHAADRHCGHGTQAAHRALALCRNGGTSRRCRNPPRERNSRVKEQELSVAILPTTMFAEPFCELASGLVAKPEPCELDHGRPCTRVPSPANAPIAVHTAALVGHRGDAHVARDLTMVVE